MVKKYPLNMEPRTPLLNLTNNQPTSVVVDLIPEKEALKELSLLAKKVFYRKKDMAETSPRFREIIRRLGIDWRATNKCAIDFKDPNLAPSTDLWGKRKRLPMNEHERYSEMCYYGPENKYFEINVKCYCDAHYFHLVTISKLIDTNSEFMDFFSVLDEASIESKYSLFCKIARKLAHCGECGYLHTDLKPENIMIDEDEMPHLVDWEFNRRR